MDLAIFEILCNEEGLDSKHKPLDFEEGIL